MKKYFIQYSYKSTKFITILILVLIFLFPRIGETFYSQNIEQETEKLDILPELRIFNLKGEVERNFLVFDSDYNKGINLATIDLGADGQDEILISAGFGSIPEVKIFREDGSEINHFLVYDENFKGGVNLAAGDLDGDGKEEIIVGAGIYGGPHVRVFDGYGRPKLTAGFFADDQGLRTGVIVTAGDINKDGKDEIICGIEKDNKFLIKIFGLREVIENKGCLACRIEPVKKVEHYLIKEFSAFDKIESGDLSLAVADTNGNGLKEIIVGAGTGQEPEVRIFNQEGILLNNFLAYDKNFRGGVRVVGGNLDRDKKDEIITGAGFSGGPHIRIFDQQGNPKINLGFFAYDKNFRGGLNIALADFNKQKKIITVPRLTLIKGRDFYKAIEIDISEQKLYSYQNGFLIEEQSISTGTKALPTPLGNFKILSKDLLKYSNRYKLYMPHWMQFTWTGAGVHGLPYWQYSWGKVYEGVGHLGKRVSHGCVRLTLEAAERIYQWVNLGDGVVVHE